MTDSLNKFLSFNETVCAEVDKILDEHHFKENLQVPHLHLAVIARLKILSEEDSKDADAIIRMYVRRHGSFHISRGAKGGIMPISKFQAKQALKEEKERIKLELEAELDAKLKEKENV